MPPSFASRRSFRSIPLRRHTYTSLAAANLRRVIRVYDRRVEIGPLGPCLLSLPICIENVVSAEEGGGGGLIKDFDTVARELHVVYSQDLINFRDPADGSGRDIASFEPAEAVPQQKTMDQPLPPVLPPVQTPYLSSLGGIEQFILRDYEYSLADAAVAKVEVKDCWLGTGMLRRSVQFHAWG
ncbi:hypothetical protein F4779DRAFT_409922 [Xylariaceae sp. FL0662B]|nr:hypothetical protein F4779DRAFT_409922 [Xylariaceae sp. FL0662B]